MTKYELDRIKLDDSGCLTNMTDSKIKLLLGMFIIGKILLPRVFIKPDSIGLNQVYKD